jgi:tripartite-type tricarboxylate transporter receptor subunit TctC
MADALKMTAVMGGSGPNDSEIIPALMNNTIGTKFRVASGYKSNSRVMLAMERGEVEGVAGSWSSLRAGKPEWLRDHLINVIVQVARKKEPDLQNVPLITDYVKTDEYKKMWDVTLAIHEMGRPAVAPPGVPSDRVKILRQAFAATVKDKDYIADMKRSKRELSPVSGEEMQATLQRVAQTPLALMKKLDRFTKPK